MASHITLGIAAWMPETPQDIFLFTPCAKMHYTQILPPLPPPPLPLLFSGLGRGARGAVSQYVVAVVVMAEAAVVVVVASSSPEFLQVPHCVVLRRGVLRTSCLSQGRMSIIDSCGQFGFFLFFSSSFLSFFFIFYYFELKPIQVVDMAHPPSSSSFLLL